MRESLQVNNKDLWTLVDFHLLKGVLMSLTSTAVPFVVSRKSFFLTEVADTVIERNSFASVLELNLIVGTEVHLFILRVLKW